MDKINQCFEQPSPGYIIDRTQIVCSNNRKITTSIQILTNIANNNKYKTIKSNQETNANYT